MHFGKSLTEAMHNRRINGLNLSEKMGFTQNYISIARRRQYVGLRTMDKFCDVLNYRASTFLSLGEKIEDSEQMEVEHGQAVE